MKKILLILLSLCIIVTGCSKDKLDKETTSKQEKVIENIEQSKEDNIVIKFLNNKKETSYYLYQIDGMFFTQYLYTIHKDQESFDEFVLKYENDTYHNLEKKEDSLVTIIMLQKGTDENVYEVIENIYKDDKNYEIIK